MSTPASAPHVPPVSPGPPPRRRGMQGNAKSMVLSMIACIAGCLVILALVPRLGATKQPTVQQADIAREIRDTQKWDVAVAPKLGSPWRAVNVQLVAGDDTHKTRWLDGFQGKGNDYMAIQQTKGGGQNWVNQIASGTDKGTQTINGVAWRKVAMQNDEKALVRSAPLGGLDTLVNGTTSWENLAKLAGDTTPYSSAK